MTILLGLHFSFLLFSLSRVEAQAWQACAGGVEYRLSSREAAQGGIIRVEARGLAADAKLEGRWGARELAFWSDAAEPGVQRALVGIDLGDAPGPAQIRLTAKREKAAPVACRGMLRVRSGRFATERLSVQPRFVEPSPEELERAEKENAVLAELWRTATPERLWRGAFRWPIEGLEPRGNFGRRRWFNNQPRSPHSGEDFGAPQGTTVVAPERGRVVLARDLFFSGNTVVLDHGLGLYTLYAHLSEMAVKEGEMVEPGGVLGKVGATGRVTGPHLHWAARLGNARVNPVHLVKLK